MKTRTSILAACAAAAAAATALTGCNIVGPAAYFVMGPEKVPRLYELDPEQPTVVLVDDPGSRVPERVVRREISKAAEQMLLDEKVIKNGNVIAGDGAMAVVAKERYGSPMGITDVGQAVGAKVVIYALVEDFRLAGDDGKSYMPKAVVRVKVMDVENKKRLWPDQDPGSYSLVVTLPTRQGMAPQNAGEFTRAQQDLAQATGAGIAKLFFEHEAKQIQGRLEERSSESR